MPGKWVSHWFSELERLEGDTMRRAAWAAAYGAVWRNPVYWLAAGGIQIAAQVAVVVPLARLLRARGLFLPVFVWVLPVAVALFACIVIVWFWRGQITRNLRRQLSERGLPTCLQCGYDLTGNVAGRCPECGRPVPPAPTPQ